MKPIHFALLVQMVVFMFLVWIPSFAFVWIAGHLGIGALTYLISYGAYKAAGGKR